MTVEDTLVRVIEDKMSEALNDVRLQQIISGQMSREDLNKFFYKFIPTHLSSIQILALLYALAPRESSDLLRDNLLEEMGAEEGGEPHPEMLIDLAKGLGFSDQEVVGLKTTADEARRAFATGAVPEGSLRDLGLAILLETVTFEAFLARISDSLAESLTGHYQLSPDAVRWFTLHGEVDIRHAEEGKRVVREYISHYRFGESEVERIVRNTFAKNVILDRYFPGDIPSTASAGPLRIVRVDILPLKIPFARSFDHAMMSRSFSDSVVVRVTDVDGIRGYGEALPRSYVTGEDVATMLNALRRGLIPQVLAREFGSGQAILGEIRDLAGAWLPPQDHSIVSWNATMCAIELALLDWAFRRAGQSVSQWLLPVREHIFYTGVIDAAGPESAGALASRYVRASFSRLKVKVGIGDDLPRLEAVRKAAGDRVRIRVDANGAWDAHAAVSALDALRKFDIEAVEQPVTAGDLEGMRRVREETGIVVVADESLITMQDAENLIQKQACDVFNVRVSKCGGLVSSKAIAELGLSAGLRVQIGAQVGETALLSAAGRHLAAHLPQLESAEGSFGTHLLTEDITEDSVMFGHEGRAGLITGLGLGVDIDDQALERLTTDIIKIDG